MKNNRWTWAALLLLGVAGLLLLLNARFPGVLAREDAQMRLVHGLLLLTLIGGSVALGWRQRAGVALKQALAWVAVALILILAYSYRDDFLGLGHQLGARVAGELMPSRPLQTAPGTVQLSRDRSGHFRANALVNGTHVEFLVDTGASDVALSAADAARLGINLPELAFTTPYQTANGTVMAARLTLDEIAIGDIRMRNVSASVARGGMSTSLLGMSFLSRLGSIEVRGDRLVLRQ